MKKVKFHVINHITKREEPYTGTFENEAMADKWYEKYGKKMEQETGKKFIKILFD